MAKSIAGGVEIINTLSTKNDGDYPLVKAESVGMNDGSTAEEIINSKLDKNQGALNKGKVLGIGADGNVIPVDAPSGGGGGTGTVEVDTTLTQSGKAADSKTVGDKFKEATANVTILNENIENKLDKNQGVSNKGKIIGVGEDGNATPLFPNNVTYNPETKNLEYGSNDTLPLSDGIKLDTTLTKEGCAASAKETGDRLKSIEGDTANLKEDLIGVKNDIKSYNDTFFKNFFALQRTGKKYTVKFPMWKTSQVSTGEKLDDNVGLVIEPSTITEKGRDDYENIPLFKTYDCNVEKIDGKLKITALKGDINFDPKEKDTFVLGMPYYEKIWVQDGYLYLSRSDTPYEGYVLCQEARKENGMRNFCLYAKYMAGRNSVGTIGSYADVIPVRKLPSYNTNITEAKKRGNEYVFGSSFDLKYIQNTFLIKYADKNWNKILGGDFTYAVQYKVSLPETDAKRVILKKAEADKYHIGSCVSVGEEYDSGKAPDRNRDEAHSLCDSAKILDIVEVDVENKALVLDIPNTITTTATTWVTSMHWRSGFSDGIKGTDGCACETKTQITSLHYPSVIQGIECMVGGYEVLGNTFMDIIDETHRDVYVCNDSTKLTIDVNTAKQNYTKLSKQMSVDKNSAWQYITEMCFDVENGINIITQAGDSGSSTNTGYTDAIYLDAATTGQREFLCFGDLGVGAISGAFCVDGNYGLSCADWAILARLSLNVYRGEFA